MRPPARGATHGGDAAGSTTTTEADDATTTTTTTTDDGSGGGDEADYVAAIADDLQSDETFPLDEEDADCVAGVLVSSIGVDAFVDAGLSPEDVAAAESATDLDVELPDDLADTIADGIGECGLAELFGAFLVDQLEEQTGAAAPDGSDECISEALASGDFDAQLAAAFIDGSDDVEASFGAALGECPDLMAAVLVASFESTLGRTLSPEGAACVQEQVAADPEEAAAALGGAESDFGVTVATACATFLGPAG